MHRTISVIACIIAIVLAATSCDFVVVASPLLMHQQHNNKNNNNATRRPVVLLHGLMATSSAMSHIEGWLKEDFGSNLHVHNLELGNGKDNLLSLIVPMNKQLEIMHERLWKDDILRKTGFDLIGHSQGGLLTRTYIQRYGGLWRASGAPIHNYISLAGVQAGQFGVPDFNDWCSDSEPGCNFLVAIVDDLLAGKWSKLIQEVATFASYWRNPLLSRDQFVNESIFLADTLNEGPVKNTTYASNIKALNKMFLLHAMEDHIVIPSMSEHMTFYAWGQDKTVPPLNQTEAYIGDWLGLRTLNENGKLVLANVQCTHQNMPRQACKSTVYEPYIRPNVAGVL